MGGRNWLKDKADETITGLVTITHGLAVSGPTGKTFPEEMATRSYNLKGPNGVRCLLVWCQQLIVLYWATMGQAQVLPTSFVLCPSQEVMACL